MKLDHLVIGAATLEQGVRYVQQALDVTLPKGGEHPLMGTHNHLMQLGNDAFLEIIAVNPAAPAPNRPRWYGLDDPFVRAQLAREPRLLTWVLNTSDLAGIQAQSHFSFGTSVPVTRGNLSWDFGLPDDGRLFAGGLLPHIMQWHSDHHPSAGMEDLGCSLTALELYHPYPDWLTDVLAGIGAESLVTVTGLAPNSTPYLLAHIQTPAGLKTLSSTAQ